jgi:hypothetical protein
MLAEMELKPGAKAIGNTMLPILADLGRLGDFLAGVDRSGTFRRFLQNVCPRPLTILRLRCNQRFKLQRWRSVANEAPPPIDQNDARATVISCGIDRCG